MSIVVKFFQGMFQKAKDRLAKSAEISDNARSKVDFVGHDLTRPWPIQDSSVDIIFGNLVLEHLEKLDFFFSEVARTLKGGGIVFVCELHPFKQYCVSSNNIIVCVT